MIDPLSNSILMTKEGIGLALLEHDDIRQHVIEDIQKTLKNPACIYESNSEENTRYYFQFFKSTVFMCIVKKKDDQWYLENTLFNPPQAQTELIIAFDKLIFAK